MYLQKGFFSQNIIEVLLATADLMYSLSLRGKRLSRVAGQAF